MEQFNLKYDKRYNTYSISAVFYLLHHSKEYNNLWIEKYPDTAVQAENFFKDENCGCRPVLLQQYNRNKFDIDLFTVQFLHNNPKALDFDDLCSNVGGQDLRGSIFSINNTVGDFKDFFASLQAKKATFTYFNTTTISDKIIICFF